MTPMPADEYEDESTAEGAEGHREGFEEFIFSFHSASLGALCGSSLRVLPSA
jgi:hypothetical protein